MSADQVKDFGLDWTILGHSERRKHFGESDEVVANKVKQAQEHGLNAIVCIGESESEREEGKTNDVLKVQLDAIKASVTNWASIVIAYEPIWAIGTGKSATPEMAQETHAYVRSWFVSEVSAEVAAGMRIQYGGSANAANSAALISQPDIDGFLVGGASLKPEFAVIVANAAQ